jgi:probable phosphoglycerate mutase
MSTRIFLIRHGATQLSAENRFSGAGDAQLSEEGKDQARRLAHRLAALKIGAVYASNYDRAVDTAQILAQPFGLKVYQRDGLREISHGRWEGMTRDEVEKQFPDEYTMWEDDPYSFAPDGGETGLAVTARALPVLLEVVRAHMGENVIVVSHKATIRLLLSSLLGFDARTYRDHLDLSPASLTILDFNAALRPRLTLYNDTAHYSDFGMAIPATPQGHLSKDWDEKK